MTNPFDLFNNWYEEAVKAQVVEPYAFVLSTVTKEGDPRSRVVLWRRFVDNVFYFFTNYTSAKGQELHQCEKAAMNFHWREPKHRQVRIQGKIQKAKPEISDEYFASRPRGSQIGAWSSPQSQEIQNRKVLEDLVSLFEEKFKDQTVPRPEFWGGFGITPDYIEFWEEGESRLHSRTVFELLNNQWTKKTLAP